MARASLPSLFAALAILIVLVNWGGRSLAISGDEPHYLMVVNSLLQDHDLELTEDYRRVARGGFEAGRRFRGAGLDHHTVLVDRERGRSMLWQEVFNWQIRECREIGCEGWRRLTADFPPGAPRSEVSAHPFGFPVFLAVLLAPFRLSPEGVEHGVNVIVALLAWLGAVLVYLTGRAAGMERGHSALAAALLGFASPWLAYSRSFFVELPAGVMLIAALYGLQRGRPILTGVATGIAFAFKPLFLLFGAVWVLERWFSGARREALRLAIPFGAIGALVGIVNFIAARRWVISGTSPWKSAHGLAGFHAQLFDSAHGLLPFVPWAIFIVYAWVAACLPGRQTSSLERQIALPSTAYLVLLSANAYLGETCYGPRYWVAILPLLALLAADALRRAPQPRPFLVGLLLFAGLAGYIAVFGAIHYPQLWDRPAVWLLGG